MSPIPPAPAIKPAKDLAKLAEQLKEQARTILRDTLLHALAAQPQGFTCGDCARCVTADRFGRCSAFPPVSFVVDGKVTSRDPIVNFDRPACVLFQELPA